MNIEALAAAVLDIYNPHWRTHAPMDMAFPDRGTREQQLAYDEKIKASRLAAMSNALSLAFAGAHPDAPADGVVAGLGEPVAWRKEVAISPEGGWVYASTPDQSVAEPGRWSPLVTQSAALAYAAAEVAREREACAAMCDIHRRSWPIDGPYTADTIKTAIRSRSAETKGDAS